MDQVFVATDGSKCGARALAFAARLAAAVHAKLCIITVSASTPTRELGEFGRMEHMTTGDLLDMEAETVLNEARKQATQLGAVVEKSHALVGDPAEQILDLIDEYKPDLVVVGRRGRGQLLGLLLGSVSQELVTRSGVAVTVVP